MKPGFLFAVASAMAVFAAFVNIGCGGPPENRNNKKTPAPPPESQQATLPDQYVDGIFVRCLKNDTEAYAPADCVVVDTGYKVWIKDVPTTKTPQSRSRYAKIFKKNDRLYIVVTGPQSLPMQEIYRKVTEVPGIWYDSKECERQIYSVTDIVVKATPITDDDNFISIFIDKAKTTP